MITRKLKCLGVYLCPHDGCLFTQRARTPTAQNKDATVRPPKITHCKIHQSAELYHHACQAKMIGTVSFNNNMTEVQHVGNHDHLAPNPIHISNPGKAIVRSQTRTTQQGSVTMLVGSSQHKRLPVDKDIALVNNDRVRKEVKRETRKVRQEQDCDRTDRPGIAINNPG